MFAVETENTGNPLSYLKFDFNAMLNNQPEGRIAVDKLGTICVCVVNKLFEFSFRERNLSPRIGRIVELANCKCIKRQLIVRVLH